MSDGCAVRGWVGRGRMGSWNAVNMGCNHQTPFPLIAPDHVSHVPSMSQNVCSFIPVHFAGRPRSSGSSTRQTRPPSLPYVCSLHLHFVTCEANHTSDIDPRRHLVPHQSPTPLEAHSRRPGLRCQVQAPQLCLSHSFQTTQASPTPRARA